MLLLQVHIQPLFNPNACASYLLFLLCVRLAEYPPYSYHRVSGARVFIDAGATAEFDEPDGSYYVEFDADYDE